MNDTWFVYIVECSNGTLYTGITNNLEKRIKAHNKGKGAKYTRNKTPVTLKISFKSENRSEASKLEYKIKQLKRADKIRLINGETSIS